MIILCQVLDALLVSHLGVDHCLLLSFICLPLLHLLLSDHPFSHLFLLSYSRNLHLLAFFLHLVPLVFCLLSACFLPLSLLFFFQAADDSVLYLKSVFLRE